MRPGPLPAALLLGATLLAACEPLPEGCHDRSEDFFRLDAFGSPLQVPTEGVHLGSFTSWGAGEVVFATTDGRQFGFGLIVEGTPTLPDLATLGTVELQARGFITDSTEPTNPLLAVFAPGDRRRLIAALGNRELTASGSRLEIEAPRDDFTCMQYGHEDGRARNKPVTVSVGEEQTTLFQGEVATLGDLDVTIVTAQSNNRSHPWAPCRDELCPWEKLAWVAVTDGLDTMALPPGEDTADDSLFGDQDDDTDGGAEPR